MILRRTSLNKMDIFEFAKEQKLKKEAPLAVKMRPRTLDEVVGQEDILGEGKMLRRAIEADRIGSLIFYGPPGCGKTTLAKVIANTTKAEFKQLNATISGKKDMEEVVNEAKKEISFSGKKTILFIDEIHRFNKAQQDFLLPYVEDGTITLIGATTENPFFEVNKALVSRSNIFRLSPLTSIIYEKQTADILTQFSGSRQIRIVTSWQIAPAIVTGDLMRSDNMESAGIWLR